MVACLNPLSPDSFRFGGLREFRDSENFNIVQKGGGEIRFGEQNVDESRVDPRHVGVVWGWGNRGKRSTPLTSGLSISVNTIQDDEFTEDDYKFGSWYTEVQM